MRLPTSVHSKADSDGEARILIAVGNQPKGRGEAAGITQVPERTHSSVEHAGRLLGTTLADDEREALLEERPLRRPELRQDIQGHAPGFLGLAHNQEHQLLERVAFPSSL
jgi:hypothetical protein